jgi:hypothetical protein
MLCSLLEAHTTVATWNMVRGGGPLSLVILNFFKDLKIQIRKIWLLIRHHVCFFFGVNLILHNRISKYHAIVKFQSLRLESVIGRYHLVFVRIVIVNSPPLCSHFLNGLQLFPALNFYNESTFSTRRTLLLARHSHTHPEDAVS